MKSTMMNGSTMISFSILVLFLLAALAVVDASIVRKGSLREEISSMNDVVNAFDEFIRANTNQKDQRGLSLTLGTAKAGPRGDPRAASPNLEPAEVSFMIVSVLSFSFFLDCRTTCNLTWSDFDR
jgi:hypothetical protein